MTLLAACSLWLLVIAVILSPSVWSTTVISMTTDHDFPDKGRKLISVRNSKTELG